MKKWLWIGLFAVWSCQAEVTITNLVVVQRPGTKLVDIKYDVLSTPANEMEISLAISNGSVKVNASNLTGSIGWPITAGTGKTIVWNAGADWNGHVASGVVFVVTGSIGPAGSDPTAVRWTVINTRWVKNTYSNGDVTMSDRETKLMWRNPLGTGFSYSWADAKNFCNNLTYAGYSDWYLPYDSTLAALYSQKAYFSGVMSWSYWSSRTYSPNTNYAWCVDMSTGAVTYSLIFNQFYVWPARSSTVSTTRSLSVAAVDTRDYVLTVSSEYGAPIPIVGTNLYAWRSTVTCAVNDVASGYINSVCSGWAGTGDVPSLGTGNSTGAILLTNLTSSIIWRWPLATFPDLWASNVTATQRSGTKLVDISYSVFSTKTNSVKVSLAVLDATNAINAETVSGAIGLGIATGAVKTMVWNAGADWNGNTSNLTFRILGQDSQGAGVTTPAGKVWLPAGKNSGTDPDAGIYSITVTNALFIDEGEVTKALWDTVCNWATTNGYSFDNAGSAMATNHPVQTISWYDAARWCNARSKMEGFTLCYNTNTWSCDFTVNGYRLPTSTEWQYAARGGLSGKRFPWGDTITHSNDNYYSTASYSYDVSTTRGFHPIYGAGTAPEGNGTTNSYGLYAMAGNVMEWCQDTSGVSRAMCGGSWDQYADQARCTAKSWAAPTTADYNIGFRTVQRASSSTSAEIPSGIPVDTRDYQLIVLSERGSPVPSVGTNLYAWRATVTGKVNSAVTSGLTNWTSAGWSDSGSVPISGVSTNTGKITLTGLVSSIVWNWNTNYWLEVVKSGSGSVNRTNGWLRTGTNLSLTVSPSNGWLFMGWSGDASGDYAATNIIVPMVCPVSITATFSDDADGDGLLNTNETALGTNPRKKDTDGDGMNDPQELIAGTSPTNNASVLSVQLSTDVSANQISWYGVSGRYYQMEYTDALGGWISKGTVIVGANAQITKLDINAAAGRFYRVRVSVSNIVGEAFSYCPCLTSVTVPASATNIESMAFAQCTSLTNVIIPGSVTNIGNEAFSECTSLTGVYFMGNAPGLGSDVFIGDSEATVYYLPRTTIWGTTFGGRPTALWMLPPGIPLMIIIR